MRKIKTILIMAALLYVGTKTGISIEKKQSKERTGTLKGKLIDKESKFPILGALVTINETKAKTLTDEKGDFDFRTLRVGNYTLVFKFQNYTQLVKPDIIVRSNRITFVKAEMDLIPVIKEEISVTSGYFPSNENNPSSKVNFSSEEVRRAPGSGGDISRSIYALPSVAKVNDFFNTLVVRGGSPSENTFFVDNIEIPNISHFPVQGSTGGPIGILNVDFIEDVEFLCGGFSSIYGDKLSSVMNITFREGNKEEFDGQIDLNMAGIGLTLESPVFKKGAWMFSARKSYLDLLVDAIGTGTAPRYSDFQGKLVYNFSPGSKISMLGIMGRDRINFSREQVIEEGDSNYGSAGSNEYTIGANWFFIWGNKLYSNTSMSQNYVEYADEFYETSTGQKEFSNISSEKIITIRNVNHLTINYKNKLDFGFELKNIRTNYDYYIRGGIDSLGNIYSKINQKVNVSAYKYAGFINYMLIPVTQLTLNLGIRADYFSYNKNLSLAPRFSFALNLTDKTTLTGAVGKFYQNLPLMLLYQDVANKELKDPQARHYILGLNHLFSNNTKLILEIYNKEYYHFPVDPLQSTLFILDKIEFGGLFFQHDNLMDTQKANVHGIEFILQKKLKNKIYGMISGSYFKTRYKTMEGEWKDRVFDNRYIFAIQGGYKPNKKWEFGMRWIFAGGTPYTPYNMEISKSLNSGIFDQNKINEARKPVYHSLNLRADRRFYFKKTNLICFLSVWNVYGRKNVADYYWNSYKNEPDTWYQWGILPVAGFEYEF